MVWGAKSDSSSSSSASRDSSSSIAPALGHGGVPDRLPGAVEPVGHVLKRAGQQPVVVDVPDDLGRDPALALAQVGERDLLFEEVVQVALFNGGGLIVFARLVAFPGPADIEAVQEDFVPVHLVLGLLLPLLVDLEVLVVVGFRKLEEGVLGELLLHPGLQLEERHVDQVHRLVEARIGLRLLAGPGTLVEAGSDAAAHGRIIPRRAGTSTSCAR